MIQLGVAMFVSELFTLHRITVFYAEKHWACLTNAHGVGNGEEERKQFSHLSLLEKDKCCKKLGVKANLRCEKESELFKFIRREKE